MIRNKEEERLVDQLLAQHTDVDKTWLGATEQIGDWHWVASLYAIPAGWFMGDIGCFGYVRVYI